MALTRRLLTAAVVLAGLLSAAPAFAQRPRPLDDDVKAVYLLNFGRFATWPAAPSAAPDGGRFSLCVLGTDPFGRALDDTIAGETIGGKSVVARRILKPEDAASCNILFVSTSEAARLDQVLRAVDRAAVLTVSDIPKFAERGGMIQFVSQGKTVRFEVNVAAAEHARLSLSSDLLRVAVAIRGGKALW